MEESLKITNCNLQNGVNNTSECIIPIRQPKRVIHCSDGVLEEYSDDEVDGNANQTETVNPKTLNWMPWVLHYAMAGGNKALEYCDYIGEGLADFLGITTPKYQLELSEYERMEAAKKKLQEESWVTPENNADESITLQPTGIQPVAENDPSRS